jgi:hypothetical protein
MQPQEVLPLSVSPDIEILSTEFGQRVGALHSDEPATQKSDGCFLLQQVS